MRTSRLWALLRGPFVLAAAWCATADIAAAQSLPILMQAETMSLAAPMTAGYDMAAMGGRFIRPTSGSNTTSPVQSASAQVTLAASGTFYLWARSPDPDDSAFVERLAKEGVLVLPGRTCGSPGHFRISLTGTAEMIERSIPVFRSAV